MAAPILEVQGLGKTFGSVTAARDITLSVPPQQTVGIIGANGAGKTTFVNLITGYIKPSSGRIRFEGRDITDLSPREITALGVCRSFQVAQVFPSMSVLDNMAIALGIARRGAGAAWRPLRTRRLLQDAERVLERYRIADYRHASASTLPQGVRKLLDIAMAVAAEPRIVLLDEPTSGISVEEKYEIMEVVVGVLRAAGLTVLFVEHDMDIVERYAERVLAFYDGTVIADGPPAEALHDAKVKQFVVGETLHRPTRPGAAAAHA
ncbi:MAG TPA: ABC transporter ATP-binding protein [Geminicoccaceae bacterium]|jgi:branched-chain amino acid transport system ATP-binding protein|nr:ABC transporter ATP-binding protein [Geminicoccaceae bacterium]